jgi:Zn-dependent protease
MEETAIRYAIAIGVTVYSCILHECAHVWSALKMGDPTGKQLGRLTLNPIPHVDPFWTILLPLWTYYQAQFPVGGPKPAPINPLNFKDPRTGMMLSGLAGPAMNLILASTAFGLLWVLNRIAGSFVLPDSYNALFLSHVIFINAGLAALNLIPVPPLDGSRFLAYILGRRSDDALSAIERLGFIPIFIAFYFLGPPVGHFVRGTIYYLLERGFGDEYALTLVRTYFGL